MTDNIRYELNGAGCKLTIVQINIVHTVFVRINARGVYFLSDCDPGAFVWEGRMFKVGRLLISIYVYEKTTM